jgi:hypothetical protein
MRSVQSDTLSGQFGKQFGKSPINKLKNITLGVNPNGNNSKLDIYFSLKNCFDREKYTQINDFEIRQSLCKSHLTGI